LCVGNDTILVAHFSGVYVSKTGWVIER